MLDLGRDLLEYLLCGGGPLFCQREGRLEDSSRGHLVWRELVSSRLHHPFPPDLIPKHRPPQPFVPPVLRKHDRLPHLLEHFLHLQPLLSAQIEEGHVFLQQPRSVGREEDEGAGVGAAGEGLDDG